MFKSDIEESSFILTNEQTEFLSVVGDFDHYILTLTGSAGCGKAQPIDAIIKTPFGDRLIGDIHPGDLVFTQSGKCTEVVSIHPQGLHETYKITFSDGTYTTCNKDHLWDIYLNKPTYTTDDPYTAVSALDQTPLETNTVTTTELIKYKKINKYLPLVNPLQYPTKSYKIHPYVVGFLAGCKCVFKGDSLSFVVDAKKTPILKELTKLLPTNVCLVIMKHSSYKKKNVNLVLVEKMFKYTTGNNPLFLLYQLSVKQFIDFSYLYGDVQQRIDLIQGLMDAVGIIQNKKVQCCFTYEVSSDIINKIKLLVYSLGGVIQETKVFNKLYCLLRINPFRFSEERKKWILDNETTPARKVISVQKTNIIIDHICIKVSDPSHLYVTNDCIVTHNTHTTVLGVDTVLKEDYGIFLLYPSHMARNVFLEKYKADKISESTRDKNTANIVKNGVLINAQTIQSFLGMRPDRENAVTDINSDSFHISKALQQKQIDILKLYKNLVIFIDEVSMVSEGVIKELIAMIENLNIEYQIIFVGDYKQLPPVNDKSSESFVSEFTSKNIVLNKIFRTNSSDIVEVSNFFYKTDPKIITAKDIKPFCGNEVNVLSTEEFKDKFLQDVVDNKDVVYLGYRNISVSSMDKLVMQVKGRESSIDFKSNDYVRVFSTIMNSSEVFSFNGETVQIATICDSMLELPWIKALPVKKATLLKEFAGNNHYHELGIVSTEELRNKDSAASVVLWQLLNACKNIDIAAKDKSINSFKSFIKKLNPTAVSMVSNQAPYEELDIASWVDRYFSNEPIWKALLKTKSIAWRRGFFGVRELITPVSTTNSLTIHKSQGQEFKIVYLDVPDILQAKDKHIINHLLYVGSSRAKVQLNIKIF